MTANIVSYSKVQLHKNIMKLFLSFSCLSNFQLSCMVNTQISVALYRVSAAYYPSLYIVCRHLFLLNLNWQNFHIGRWRITFFHTAQQFMIWSLVNGYFYCFRCSSGLCAFSSMSNLAQLSFHKEAGKLLFKFPEMEVLHMHMYIFAYDRFLSN